MPTVFQTRALPGYEPEIGRWLWAMQEVRHRTLDVVGGPDQRTLDWEGPDRQENAIGSFLYHIALVEVSWLFLDILGRDLPTGVRADFPHAMGTQGRITGVPSLPLADHLGRLERGRGVLLETFRGMSLDTWDRLLSPGDSDTQVTPAWAVFHLVEHESGHAAQIAALKARAARFFRDAGGLDPA